jgi:hypothetical protein
MSDNTLVNKEREVNMYGNAVGSIYKKPEVVEEVVFYESELETFVGFIFCVVIGFGTLYLSHFV